VLRRLAISNLVLIREADLDLHPGLNAITGETGAGKTILTNAIGLLLGARGDAAQIGPAGEEASSRRSSSPSTTTPSARWPTSGRRARTGSSWRGGSSPTGARGRTRGVGQRRARTSRRPRRR